MTNVMPARINGHREAARKDNPLPYEKTLDDALSKALDDARCLAVLDDARWEWRVMHRLTAIEDRLFPRHRQITVTRVALALLAFVGILAGPGVAGYALWQIFGPAPIGDGNSLVGGHPGPVAWTCAQISVVAMLVRVRSRAKEVIDHHS